MTEEIKKKLFIYTFIVLFFGLLQVWSGTIYYGLRQKEFSFWQFLTQFGIYFFASSLTASSWWKHFKLYNNIDFFESVLSTLFAFVFILLLLLVYFSGLDFNETTKKYEFSYTFTHQLIAFGSIIVAISYGIYTEKRTFLAKTPITKA